jgi:hypothetical protein
VDWNKFLIHLQSKHPGEAQNLARIAHGIGMIKEGLQMLAQMGHHYHLTAEGPLHVPDWPKMMFHVDSAPNGRLVNSEFELDDLGPGWFSTLEAAQFWDGLDTQFAGRGGVARKGLPQVLNEVSIDDLLAFAVKQAQAKAERIAAFKAARKGSTPGDAEQVRKTA